MKLLKSLALILAACIPSLATSRIDVLQNDPSITIGSMTLTTNGAGIKFADGTTQTTAGGSGGAANPATPVGSLQYAASTTTFGAVPTSVVTATSITYSGNFQASTVTATVLQTNGAGPSGWNGLEGSGISCTSGYDAIYPNSSTHAMYECANGGAPGPLIYTTATITTGHLLSYSGSGQVVDGGTGGGGGSTNGTITASPQYQLAAYSLLGTTTTVAGSTNTFVTPSSMTLTFPMLLSSTGTISPVTILGKGSPGGGVQQRQGYLTIGDDSTNNPVSAKLVIVDSTTDSQVGAGQIEVWEDNPNNNDPVYWEHRASNNSAPDFRVDAPAPNMEVVATSTDNAHGRGKWETWAIPSASEILQGNSRCWDNSSFENAYYWEPLNIQSSVAKPGLFLQAQSASGCDSGIVISSNTSGVNFFTQNNHTIGITGPLNVASGSWRLRLPSTIPAAGQIMYMGGADAFSDYPMLLSNSVNLTTTSMTVTGSGGLGITYGVTAGTITVQNITINGTCTGSGCGSGGGASTTTVSINGSVLTSAATSFNFIPSAGELISGSTPSVNTVNLQFGPDPAVYSSRANLQSGATLLCKSASASGTTYTCALNPTLTSYTTGMVLTWIPDVSGTGGATTLNIDSLGAINIKEGDGTTNPTNKDIVTGTPYSLIMDSSTVFRLKGGTAQNLNFSTGAVAGFNEYANGVYAAISTVTWSNGNDQTVTLTANTSFNFVAPNISTGTVAHLNLLIQTGSGSFTASWPSSVKWPSGSAPTITTGSSKADFCSFYYRASTGDYLGQCAQNFTP